MRIDYLEPEFVEFVPTELQSGVLYISMTYATTVHLCASGCGNKVVLPLNPAEWQMCFDGEAVSMTPSVGNWEYPCRSHYWIRKNRIKWAPQWSKERIEAGRLQDERDLHAYFDGRSGKPEPEVAPIRGRSLWQRIRGFFVR